MGEMTKYNFEADHTRERERGITMLIMEKCNGNTYEFAYEGKKAQK